MVLPLIEVQKQYSWTEKSQTIETALTGGPQLERSPFESVCIVERLVNEIAISDSNGIYTNSCKSNFASMEKIKVFIVDFIPGTLLRGVYLGRAP